eukprot:4767-Rhodomonas_salina.2
MDAEIPVLGVLIPKERQRHFEFLQRGSAAAHVADEGGVITWVARVSDPTFLHATGALSSWRITDHRSLAVSETGIPGYFKL